jgi:poly(hydroxyalkanoate) granule-associated protein
MHDKTKEEGNMDNEAEQAAQREHALADAVTRSARQIWQAGLGAYAKAQREGGDMYARLVQEGSALQSRLQHLAGSRIGDASGAVSKLTGEANRQAAGSLEKLEKVFEDRVARTLRSLGMPTREDVHALSRQIQELHVAVMRLESGKAGTGKSAAKSAAKPKPASAARAAAKPKPGGKTSARRSASRA